MPARWPRGADVTDGGSLSYGDLVSPWGLIGRVDRVIAGPCDGRPSAWCAVLGDLERVLPNIAALRRQSPDVAPLAGVGIDEDDAHARVLAISEALERYSAAVVHEPDLVRASALELGRGALDLSTLPRSSDRELGDPFCPLRLPDPTKPIRWVRGWSLTRGRSVWIPAVMVFIRIPYRMDAERFWIPVSTGTAAHPSSHRALVNGINEVVERDAVAVLWLQKLQLPRIQVDVDLGPIASDALTPGLHGTIHLFDATTDVGVPTVYAVNEGAAGADSGNLVACATSLEPHDAVRTVLVEELLHRRMVSARSPVPADPRRFTQPYHGTRYMADPGRTEAFRFLLSGSGSVSLSSMESLGTGDDESDLELLVRLLEERGMECYAVDLTTRESAAVGVRVVRVLVPGLQPLSFRPPVQFRGHGRLYEAAEAMGHRALGEDELNPWPQPFG